MKITERQKLILDKVIQEYIDSAQPISSQLLEKKYDFGICPASIRIEMQKLTDKGFLFQPHTSAGRIPTDKGYRFFVDSLLARQSFTSQNLGGLEKEISEFKDVLEIEDIFKEARKDILKWASNLTKFLAEESSNFAILHLLERDLFWKEGWEEVFEEPEFGEKRIVSDFFKLLENFEEKIEDLKVNSGIKIYIGRETPFPKAKDFSIISSKCHFLDEGEGIVSLLGPKRMAYERNIALINSFKKILEKF